MKATLTAYIKQTALEIGFDAIGVAQADFLREDAPFFKSWLDRGYQAEMAYLERNQDKRLDPRELVEGCKSVIVVLMNYYPTVRQPEGAPLISKYSYSAVDYHTVIKEKLLVLENRICDAFGTECFNYKQQHRFVDSAPVMERSWAERAGLGWIGKNKLLISPMFGSFCFIGILLINKELEYDERIPDRCGSCSRCMNACPANALSLTEGLNSNSCISYQTIEKKGEISEEIRPALSGYVFGCDICQDVCPWNRKKSTPNKHEEFRPQDEILKWGKDEWLSVQQEEFNRIFKTSALRRAGFRKLRENISYEYGKNS